MIAVLIFASSKPSDDAIWSNLPSDKHAFEVLTTKNAYKVKIRFQISIARQIRAHDPNRLKILLGARSP